MDATMAKRWLKRKRKPLLNLDETQPVSAVDLFSGCGGISAGLEAACILHQMKLNIRLAVDIMPTAKSVFLENFPGTLFIDEDISKIINGEIGSKATENEIELVSKIGKIMIVTGGPPCQGHSDLNNHTRRDDPRNDLYLRMIRFVELVHPEIVVIENVQTVTRSKTGVVDVSKKWLNKWGYSVEDFTLKATDLGVAQRRKRHFTIGLKGKYDLSQIEKLLPKHAERAVLWAIDDLDVGDSLFDTPSTHQKQNVDRIAWLHGENWTDEEKHSDLNIGSIEAPLANNLPNHRRPPCHQNGHNYPAVYGKMFADIPSSTITGGFGSTGQGRFVHPLHKRTLTPHEAARVQGFPDYFIFKSASKRRELHKMIGNAVPPMMALELFNAILIIMDN